MEPEDVNQIRIAAEWQKCMESPLAKVRDGDLYPMLHSWIEAVNPHRILDIACGTAICSQKISLENRHYLGVELSTKLLGVARRVASSANSEVRQGNALLLPVTSDSIDAVFTISVWNLLGDLDRAAAEIARVLVPEGAFFLVLANPASFTSWMKLYSNVQLQENYFIGRKVLEDGFEVEERLFLHTAHDVEKALRLAGLKIESQTTFRRDVASGIDIYWCLKGRKRCQVDPIEAQ